MPGFDAPLIIETFADFDWPTASGSRITAQDTITRASATPTKVRGCLTAFDFFIM